MKPLGIVLFALVTVCGTAQTLVSQKVIKDPEEYNAYITALMKENPAEKAALIEAFVQRYPASIVKVDALEQAMGAYQQAGNAAKVKEKSAAILEIEPGNVRALAIQAYLTRAEATQGNAEAAGRLGSLADRGLKALPGWQKPEVMSDDDFAQLVRQLAAILNGAAGFAELQKKNYGPARDFFLKSIAVDPNNLPDEYQLSIAELVMTPLDPNGFWHAAKAINLAKGTAAQDSIAKSASAMYKLYHGGTDGWDQIVSGAENQTSLPDGFGASIKPAPTPAELAVRAVRDNDLATLSIGDWEFVLSYRDASAENKEAAEKVWQALQAWQKAGRGRLELTVKIISATATTVEAALSEENRTANNADLEITLAKPLRKHPAVGSEWFAIGEIREYRLNPVVFLMTAELFPKIWNPPEVTSPPRGDQN